MTPAITSPSNDRIKAVRRLQRARERRASGKTVLEGPNLLTAALGAGVVPEAVFVAAGETAGVDAVEVSPAVLDVIAPTETPRGPIAVIAIPDPEPLVAANTLVLWEVADPGNAGTLIRSAAALGWNVARHGGADPWGPKVLRSGAGAHFSVRISEVESVEELRAANLRVLATVSSGGSAPAPVDDPVALLVGNEAAGLPRDIVESADATITIPMEGVESFNAAVAGSIAMYALRPRRE